MDTSKVSLKALSVHIAVVLADEYVKSSEVEEVSVALGNSLEVKAPVKRGRGA